MNSAPDSPSNFAFGRSNYVWLGIGIAILMVEQNAKQALSIADKGFVLVQGRNRYTDTGAALLADKDVRKAFLGG